jgi:hypothetical protein
MGSVLQLRNVSRIVVVAAVAALLVPSTARAFDRPDALHDASAFFARHDVDVRCPTVAEWTADRLVGNQAAPAQVMGYTLMFEDVVVLAPAVCAGALGVTDPALPLSQRATAVLVLVHEAFHVRRWEHRWVEHKVECLAIRRFTLGAILLGASPELARELLPHALAAHRRMGELSPQYADPGCLLP